MVMGKTAGMHQHPALLCVADGAVVAQEPAAAPLKVDPCMVERDVDGVRGAVVVGPEEGLLVRPVPHHEVHH